MTSKPAGSYPQEFRRTIGIGFNKDILTQYVVPGWMLKLDEEGAYGNDCTEEYPKGSIKMKEGNGIGTGRLFMVQLRLGE
jgi:hypothetical protein